MHLGSVLVGILIGLACGLLIGWLGGRIRRPASTSSPPAPQEERTSLANSPPEIGPATPFAPAVDAPVTSWLQPTITTTQITEADPPGIAGVPETGSLPPSEAPPSEAPLDPDRELVAKLRAANRRLTADAHRLSREASDDWRPEPAEAETSSAPAAQGPQSSAADLLEWSQKLAEDARRRLARE